eukprot:g11221.t1
MRIVDLLFTVNLIALASLSCGEASPAAGWGATKKAAASSTRGGRRRSSHRRVFGGRHTCSALAFLGRRPSTSPKRSSAGAEAETVGALSSAVVTEPPAVGGAKDATAADGSLAAETADGSRGAETESSAGGMVGTFREFWGNAKDGTVALWTNFQISQDIRKRVKAGHVMTYAEHAHLERGATDRRKLLQYVIAYAVSPKNFVYVVWYVPGLLPSTFEKPHTVRAKYHRLALERSTATLDGLAGLENRILKAEAAFKGKPRRVGSRPTRRIEKLEVQREKIIGVLEATSKREAFEQFQEHMVVPAPAPPSAEEDPKTSKKNKKQKPQPLKLPKPSQGVPGAAIKAIGKGTGLSGWWHVAPTFYVRFCLSERLRELGKMDDVLRKVPLESLSERDLREACDARAIDVGSRLGGDNDPEDLRRSLGEWLELTSAEVAAGSKLGPNTAENFKSYAGTQTIGPFKDFTAVIGPNGAGKSNLMDAISFVLGVQSKHLRSTKLSDLVFRADGNVPSSRRAMVKVVYMVGEGEEVGGQEAGEEVHFSRVISAGGASSYRLNDKEVTWESYEKRLRSIGVLVKARNFLVFQGDVESIASKSPKELTQLFEQISGSDASKAEYEELKAAKKKAEEDTIFSFKRKKGCQAERKLVKEQKEEAERFQQKLKEMEDLKIESFLVQLFHINKDVDEREGDIKLMKDELEEAQEREKEAEVVLKAKKKELSRLNRELSKAQAELNRQKRLRDDMGPQHIKIKEGISTLKRQVADGEKAGEKIARDREAQRGTMAALSRDIAAVKQREEAASSGGKGDGKNGAGSGSGSGSGSGGLAHLSEAKAAEYEKLKADARARGSGQREEMADVERQLASARSKLDQLLSEQTSLNERLAGFDSSAKRFRQRQGDMEKATLKARKDREDLQRELDDLTGRSKGDALRATEIEDALRSINEQLRDAKDGRRMTKHQEKMAECLETLKRMFRGVRGRLVDLCKPTQRKYNVAVTTAAGKFMDAIVVDTKAECLECLSYMQTNKIGTAQFIPLDAIKVKPIDESLRSLGPEHRLCADIMQGGDEGVRRAILFAVGNTVVSDTLDAARVLCSGQDGKKIKAVTLKGFLISKSGNMTGGTTARDLDRAGQWDEKEFSDLKQRRQELESERDTLSREHRNRSLKTELETKIRGLQSREKHSSADLEITREELKSISTHRVEAEAERTKVTAELGERETEVGQLEGNLRTLQVQVDAVENEVFAPFLKSVGASDIRSFEEGQLKDMQEQYKARMKLQQHRSRLEAQLAHERSRDFDGPLEKVTRKTEAKRKELEDQQLKMQELIDSEKRIMEAEDEASKEHLAAKEVARGYEAEVKAAHAGRQKLVKERDGIGKRISTEESALEQLRAKLHGVLQEAKVEQAALPLVGGGTLAGGDGDKGRGRKRGRGDGDEEEEEEEEGESEESSTLDGARSSGASGLSLSASGTQDSSTAHFSQTQNRSVQEDRAEALEVDLSKLKRHRGAKDAAALEELVSSYRKQMLELQGQINQMTPNMRAVERFGDVSDRLKASGQTFEQSKQNAAGAVLKFNEAKQRRYDAFMQAYAHVSENLNAIYKDLTRSSKHPLGGNAFLSLDNPEEPYLGGVKFNAMPPMKRFRDMDQLSGGEKTVAALGLLFAIHSYRPAPFFVMDEIDAALDNINVKKVCNYIQGRSNDFQSIVISLKDMFYEKADALVGICRDHATNSSRTLTLDLEAVGEA